MAVMKVEERAMMARENLRERIGALEKKVDGLAIAIMNLQGQATPEKRKPD